MVSTLRYAAIGFCVMLFCTAGAQGQQVAKVKQAEHGGQKTIGLIAALGDTLTVATRGKSSISDEERRFSVENWKISDRVAAAVTAKLGKSFTVKRIPAPSGVFTQLGNPGFFSPDFDDNYRRLVRAIAADHKADLYLVITPGYSRIEQGDQIARGLGVVRSETLLTKKDVIYALVLYRLFDAQFRLIRSEGAMLGKGSLTETIAGAHLDLEDSKRLPHDARTAAADSKTKDLALDLLDKDLAATLPKLLGGK